MESTTPPPRKRRHRGDGEFPTAGSKHPDHRPAPADPQLGTGPDPEQAYGTLVLTAPTDQILDSLRGPVDQL